MTGYRAYLPLVLAATLMLWVPATGWSQSDAGASTPGASSSGASNSKAGSPGTPGPASPNSAGNGTANNGTSDDTGDNTGDDLTGRLIVATPSLHDPNFAKTVIFIVHHDADGAFGIVVNKVLGTAPAGEVVEQFGVDKPHAKGKISVHFGGPVGPFSAFIIHSTDYKDPQTNVVTPDIAVTSDSEILAKIARGEGPRHSLVAIGYAGWGPGQLESEIGHGAWYVAPADLSILFSSDVGSEWSRAIATGGVEL